MTSQSANVSALLNTAVSDGILSKGALTALNITDIGADINAALGVSVDDVKASEVILVTQLIDDSSSIHDIRENPNDHRSKVVGPELIRMGHNLIIDALRATKQKDGVLASTSLLNRGLVYPYTPIDTAALLDDANYRAGGGTPLYDKAIVTLGLVLAKSQEFSDNGVPCRSITAIVTDGADYGSSSDASDVAKIVRDLLRQENHIVAGVGIDDGRTNFRSVFGDMGIRDEWILTPKNSPSEIRRAFNTLSQSAVRASQAAGATFSQAAMGGFGSP